jgi:hypothetical protein
VAAYEALLASVHERAPLAPLVLLLSPMVAEDLPQPRARSTLRSHLEQIAENQRARGHSVLVVEQYIERDEGVGCDFHPNVLTHMRLGRELADALRSLLGW